LKSSSQAGKLPVPQEAATAEPVGIVRTTFITMAVNKEVDLVETISSEIPSLRTR
jgi:hypothetical protein